MTRRASPDALGEPWKRMEKIRATIHPPRTPPYRIIPLCPPPTTTVLRETLRKQDKIWNLKYRTVTVRICKTYLFNNINQVWLALVGPKHVWACVAKAWKSEFKLITAYYCMLAYRYLMIFTDGLFELCTVFKTDSRILLEGATGVPTAGHCKFDARRWDSPRSTAPWLGVQWDLLDSGPAESQGNRLLWNHGLSTFPTPKKGKIGFLREKHYEEEDLMSWLQNQIYMDTVSSHSGVILQA